MTASQSPRFQRAKRAVKNYLGVPEDDPDSVSLKDFVKGHKAEVKPAVSGTDSDRRGSAADPATGQELCSVAVPIHPVVAPLQPHLAHR